MTVTPVYLEFQVLLSGMFMFDNGSLIFFPLNWVIYLVINTFCVKETVLYT